MSLKLVYSSASRRPRRRHISWNIRTRFHQKIDFNHVVLELASDGIFSGSRIPILGFRNRDFLFWAGSKNPENPDIPGIAIKIWKYRKNPEWKIPKNHDISGIGNEIWKSRKNFFESRDFNPRDSRFFLISGYLSPGFSGNPQDFNAWDLGF